MAYCVHVTNVEMTHTLKVMCRSSHPPSLMVGICHLPRMSINDIRITDVDPTGIVSRMQLLRTAWHVRRRKRRQRRFGKAALSPHFLISRPGSGIPMRTQFTSLTDCLVLNQFMKHLTGDSKKQ